MNIFEALGMLLVTLFAAFGLSLLIKFAYDGARLNLPSMFITAKKVRIGD